MAKVARGRNIIEIPDDPETLAKARDLGYEPVTEAEASRANAVTDAATIGGGAQGLAEGGLRGLTLGGSDVGLRALGVNTEGLAARSEGMGSKAAELAGAIAPAFFTAGGSAAGSAASVAARLTPAALAARAGAAATRVVGRGTGSKVLGAAAQGGVEGALAGAGQAASQLALGDQDLAVERIVAGGVEGLGMGLLLGGGLGVAGKGLGAATAGAGKLGRQALGSLGPAAGKADDSLASLSPREGSWVGLGRGLAKIQGRDPDTYGPLFGSVANRKGRDRILADGGEVVETTARGIKDAADAMNEASAVAVRVSGGANKRARMASLAPEARPRSKGKFARGPRSFAVEHIDEQIRQIDNVLDDPLLSKAERADANEMKRIYSVARRDADKVKTPDQAFMALDDAKRHGDTVASRRHDQYQTNKSPEALKAWQRARSFTDGTRAHLEDANIYGEMAGSQQRMNAAIAADMKAQDALPPHLQAFMAKGAIGDSATAMSLARKSTRFGGESQHEAFQAALDAKLNRFRATREETVLDADQLQKLDDAERAIGEMRAKLEEASEIADIQDRLQKARKDEGGGSPSLTMLSSFGPAAGAGLGFMLGGLPGAMAGSLAGLALRPFTLVRGLAAAGNMLERVRFGTESVASREASIVSNFERLADGGRQAARTAARAAQRGTAAGLRKGAPEESKIQRQARLLAVRSAVLAAGSNPVQVAEDMETAVAELHDLAPDVARGIVERSSVAVQFLAAKAPDVYEPEFGPQVKIADPAELDRFERYVAAVTDPLEAVDKISRGVLDIEAAETLKTVYPKIFGELQSRVLDMLGRRKQEGLETSHEALEQLGLLLDMPLTDSLKPGFLAPQQAPQQAPPAGPAPRPPSKPRQVTGVRSELGRLEAGELRG